MSGAGISFVIPVLNEQTRVVGLLENLRQRYPGAEIIVVDGGSTDATVALAMPLANALLVSPPGRAAQMNLGCQVASRAYVFFLHADSAPTVAAGELSALLAAHPVWGFCRVQLDGLQAIFRFIERAMNVRSRLTRIATGDQMLFARRDTLLALGGYADIPLMEDVELCKRLRREAVPLIIAQPVLTSARRWRERGVWRTIFDMWGLRLAYLLGVSPQSLRRYYYDR